LLRFGLPDFQGWRWGITLFMGVGGIRFFLGRFFFPSGFRPQVRFGERFRPGHLLLGLLSPLAN